MLKQTGLVFIEYEQMSINKQITYVSGCPKLLGDKASTKPKM
jgi:hypothetical protein